MLFVPGFPKHRARGLHGGGGTGLSVISPAFNAERTLARAIASVRFPQTAHEIIIVDDGSSDATNEIAHRLAERNRRLKVVRQDNRGVAAARNAAIREARGEWLLFLDSDDSLFPNAEQAFARAIAHHPDADVIVARAAWIDRNGRRRPYPRGDLCDAKAALARHCGIAIHSAIVRTSLAVELGGFDERLSSSEDWDFWVRLARRGARFAMIDDVVAAYHARPHSLTRDVLPMAKNHLDVLARNYAPDPRIGDAEPAAEGDLAFHQLAFLLWSGARAVLTGDDPARLFALVAPHPDWDLDVDFTIQLIHDAITDYLCTTDGDLHGEWRGIRPGLERLLEHAFPGEAAARVRLSVLTGVKHRLHNGKPWSDEDDIGAGPLLARQIVRHGRALGWTLAHPRTSSDAAARIAASIAPTRWTLAHGQPWRSLAFWRGLAPTLTNLRGYGARRTGFDPGWAKTLAVHRLRAGLRDGLAAAMGATDEVVAAPGPRASVPTPKRPEAVADAKAWDTFFSEENPWRYDSAYETEKYALTLSLFPEKRPARALELACAEGHCTPAIADRVETLVASDISAQALARAKERVGPRANVSFAECDLFRDPLPAGPFDLVVCSEVLYYAADAATLSATAAKMAAALAPGGRIVLAHANLITDDPSTSGFDWGHAFGARAIGEAFASAPGLSLAHEIRTPLYRIQAFDKAAAAASPVIVARDITATIEPRLARDVMWDGAVMSRTEAMGRERALSVPVLMYHRIGAPASPGLAPYAVAPEDFTEQMRFLRRNGYWTPSLAQWREAMARCMPLPGRPVLITFDDGYRDFAETAWPILKRNALGASLFVVSERVGQAPDWDHDGGDEPLLGWDDLRALADEGVEIASHNARHVRLTRTPIDHAIADGAASREMIRERIGGAVEAIAYPFGGADPAVRAGLWACGYRLGFTARPGLAAISGDPMMIPRQIVARADTLHAFAQKLGLASA